MSLSREQNTAKSPSVKFFNWSGSEGKVKYYDKETKQSVLLDLPFRFIKLDSLSTVTGYSDSDESSFWANEVRSIKSEPFVVKTNKGIKREGLWSDIGEGLKAQGAKFANSVYLAYTNESGELELCNFKFYGSSITQWIEFLKVNRGHAVSITGATKAKKGSNTYYTPEFEALTITEDQLNQAKVLDRELQVYLDAYFDYGNRYQESKVASASATGGSLALDVELEDSDDLPF